MDAKPARKRKLQRHAKSFLDNLHELLTPAMWKQAKNARNQKKKSPRWATQPLVLTLLAMTWCCGDSMAERFEIAKGFTAVCLRKQRRPGETVQGFQEAIEQRKDFGNAFYGLGRAQMGLDKYQEAHDAFIRYVELHPQDASGHYALGMTLQALQRPDEARSKYEKSIQLMPAQTESYFQLGLIDLDAGNLKSAADRFNRVLNQDPHHAGALTGAGRVEFQSKDYARAVEVLQKATQTEPSLREAHYYLGLSYARLGRKDDSERELQTAIQLEKEDLEKHRTFFKIIDPDQAQSSAGNPSQ